jgi:hypothetical protein
MAHTLCRPLLFAIGLAGVFANGANAQFIEINASVKAEREDSADHGSLSLVFDTRAAPEVMDDGSLFFRAISGTTFTGHRSPSPFGTARPKQAGTDVFSDPLNDNIGAGIFVDSSDNAVVIFASKQPDLDRYDPRTHGVSLEFFSSFGESTIPALHLGIDSLPDDPADYAFELGEGRSISAIVNHSHTIASYSDDRQFRNIFYTAALTTDPHGTPCSSADVNHDGLIDAWDGNLFSASYSMESPLADVNGDGKISFADVGDFVTAYLDGCGE